jgi:hypothetical protein
MEDKKEKKASEILKDLNTFLFGETKKEEQKSTEEKKDVKLESVLEDGEYELADGRMIIIEGGNVTEVRPAPEAEETEAEAEDLGKHEDEEEEDKQKLAAQTKEDLQLKAIEELKAEVVKLSLAKPLNNAPAKKAPKELIEITSSMTYLQRVQAGIANNTN